MRVTRGAAIRIVYDDKGRQLGLEIDGRRLPCTRDWSMTDGYRQVNEMTITFLPGKVEVVNLSESEAEAYKK